MTNPIVSINIVVLNGEKYIEHCLNALLNQSFSHEQIQINILDNGSTDNTRLFIQDFESRISTHNFPKVNFVMSNFNHGMWGGQEELLKQTQSPYVVFLSADVILGEDFIQNAVATMNKDSTVGALQAKIYQFSADNFELDRTTIDTAGFKIFRSRQIGNIGHGAKDTGQFDRAKEIFGVEGAVPIFRKEALESIRVLGEIADHDLFWYGEDLDVAWRLHLAGWKQFYDPSVVAWHDRGTSKSHTHGSWLAYIRKVRVRKQISTQKRRLEWRNTRWTRIKNDHIINILRDLPYITWREIEVLGYAVLFEPQVLLEIPRFFKLLPKMLRKRRQILGRAKVSATEVHHYFS